MRDELNAVILARVSSKAQEDEGYSLDSQMKLLNSYCDNKQLKVVKVFKIAETASKEQGRKVFNELMAFLLNEAVFHLTVEKTDRLSRNFRDAVAIDEWLEQDSRRMLHAVKENLLLHKEARSDVKFMWNIHISVAKKYTDNLREEAMKGWAEKLAQGWLPALPPPGYKSIVQNGKRIHMPNAEIAPLIQRAFRLYIEPNQSIASVADAMKQMGITTAKGRPYYKSQVQRILTNPFYIGINRFDGKEYPGAQVPIISKELFDKVQQKMRRKHPIRYRNHNPVLKNLISCNNCKGMVTWQLQKGRYYGSCQRTSDGCRGRKLIRQDKIELEIVAMLKDLVSPSQEVIEWVSNAMKEMHSSNAESSARLAESVQTQIERVHRMDKNLYEDKLSGDISKETYDYKHIELLAKKRELEESLSSIDITAGLRLEKKLEVLKLSQKAAEIYSHKTPDQKRTIITKLFENLTYSNGAVSVNYTNFSRAIAQNVVKTHKILGGV